MFHEHEQMQELLHLKWAQLRQCSGQRAFQDFMTECLVDVAYTIHRLNEDVFRESIAENFINMIIFLLLGGTAIALYRIWCIYSNLRSFKPFIWKIWTWNMMIIWFPWSSQTLLAICKQYTLVLLSVSSDL